MAQRSSRQTQLPGSAPDPLFQSAAVLSAPTPSPSSSSPLHEPFVVFAGTPALAAASPSCAASPVQSASWAVSQYVIKMNRRTNAHSGPVAALLWNYPAGPPPPEQTVMVNRQTLHTDTCKSCILGLLMTNGLHLKQGCLNPVLEGLIKPGFPSYQAERGMSGENEVCLIGQEKEAISTW